MNKQEKLMIKLKDIIKVKIIKMMICKEGFEEIKEMEVKGDLIETISIIEDLDEMKIIKIQIRIKEDENLLEE